MRSRVNQCHGLGRGLAQNGNEFVQVFGLAVKRRQFDLAGKQPRQGAVVAVQIKSLPCNATLIKPARAGGGFDAFAHVSFGLHGQYQAMFCCFHMSRLNRYWFVVLLFVMFVVCGVGVKIGAVCSTSGGLPLRGRRAIARSQKR